MTVFNHCVVQYQLISFHEGKEKPKPVWYDDKNLKFDVSLLYFRELFRIREMQTKNKFLFFKLHYSCCEMIGGTFILTASYKTA